jgi:thioredoxin-related protein
MKKFILIATLSFLSEISFAQEKKLYDPTADPEKDIAIAVKKAKAENKFVLLQGGGNWCSWCIEFARFVKADPQLDSAINAGFIWYHLNYSKENKNEKTFFKYDYAQRFGFPVFIILNGNGERIHTQNSAYLEDGKKSYDKSKVLEFLKNWSPLALDPKTYQQKQP